MSSNSSKGVRLGRWVVKRNNPNACRACRERDRQCEKTRPCRGCSDLGIRCTPFTKNPEKIMIAPNTRRGGRGFYRFIGQLELLVPQDEFPQAYHYWWHGIAQTTQRSNTMMDVIHCKAIINDLPRDHLLSAALPAEALDAYNRSLRRPVTNDILLLAMVTNLYIEIEWLLGHFENLDAMVRSMFAILSSMMIQLQSWRFDTQLLHVTIMQLQHLTCESCVNTDCVPPEQWNTVMSFQLKLTRELGLSAACRLELQMLDIKYKLGRENLYDASLGWQIAIWEHNIREYKKPMNENSVDLTFIKSLESRFKTYQIFWHSYLSWAYQNESSRLRVEAMIEERTKDWEAKSDDEWVKKLSKVPCFNIFVHVSVVRDAVYAVWHSRSKSIERRLEKVVEGYRPWMSYCDELLEFMRTLAGTEFGERTAREIEVFGPDAPFFLFVWQANRLSQSVCLDHVRKIESSESES